ncbi:MAG: DUF2497 domain-containing protein [Bauldia sp.]
MAANPAQNASVEEILSSIRQAISDDDAKRTQERYRSGPRAISDKRTVVDVPVERETEVEQAMMAAMPEAESGDGSPDQDVIEQAIEQALNGVRAELEGSKATIVRPMRSQKPEELAAGAAGQRAVPRARVATAARGEAFSPRRSLLSAQTGANVTASFDDLAKAMMGGNARKLDEVVEELLRPMLKTWLEGNLPQMVERMVREEIERVSRGRR